MFLKDVVNYLKNVSVSCQFLNFEFQMFNWVVYLKCPALSSLQKFIERNFGRDYKISDSRILIEFLESVELLLMI